MNLKKVTTIILSCILFGAIFAGCGDTEKSEQKSEEDSVLKIGRIVYLNATEKQIDEIMSRIEKVSGTSKTKETVYFESLNLMMLGLESGKVNEISTYKSVSNYLVGKNDKIKINYDTSLGLKDSFCFAVLADNYQLKKQLDRTIEEMSFDGTLGKLTKEYITDLKAGEEPPSVKFEKIDGAETLKVAVTGDLPPLDLVLANGQPAGFNTALLAEVGKRLNKNIETVQIDGAARAAALSSEKVDIVFWAVVPVVGDERPSDIDAPAEIVLSSPYFSDEIVHVDLKK